MGNRLAEMQQKTMREKEAYMEQLRTQFLEEIRKLREGTAPVSMGHRFLSKMEGERRELQITKQEIANLPHVEFKAGDMVRLRSNSMKATVLQKLENFQYLILAGNVKIQVAGHEMILLEKSAESSPKVIINVEMEEDRIVSPKCDLRGLKSEEAIDHLEKYLDDARMAHLNRVVIVHGKGTGKLREEVGKFLKESADIKSFKMADWNEGGSGATVVELE